jgi:hypothetical protein
MTGKRVQTATEPDLTPPPQALTSLDAASVIQSLDRIRDVVLSRLEKIESMALEQKPLVGQETSDRERALQERVARLEATLARLQAESRRKEQEWEEVLEKLESDRMLLTEAWDRLERQQIEAPPAAATAVTARAPVASTSARLATSEEGDDPVTRAVLWQFQALKSDVRRNAKGRSRR